MLINVESAETLWRLLQRHGIPIPDEIDEPVCRYLNGKYPSEPSRRHTLIMEEFSGASMIGELLGLVHRKKEINYALSCLLNEPSVRGYLTRS